MLKTKKMIKIVKINKFLEDLLNFINRSYKTTVLLNNLIIVYYNMAKIGYAPKWGDKHTKVMEDFQAKKGEQGKHSPKFDDVDKALTWLNNN